MLRVNVNLVTATMQETEVLTSGRVGLQCGFTFSEEWDGLVKVATFEGAETADVAILTSDNIVTVPAECLSSPGAKLRVGACGMNADGDIVIPTIWVNAGRIQQGAEPSGIPASEPSPNWAAQVQEAAASALEIARGVKAEADNGEFDGEAGISPTATVVRGDSSVTVTITDANGTTSAEVYDGQTGATGGTGPAGNSTWVSTVKPDPVEYAVYEDDPDYQMLAGGEFATSGLKGRTGQAPQVGDIISYPGSYDSNDEWDTQYSGLYVIYHVNSTSVWGDYKGDIIGPKGDTGNTGAAATVTTGTTTTLAPGSYATVTNTGTSSAAVLNFGIPKGDTGPGPSDAQVQAAVDDYLDDHPTVTGTFTNEAKYALISLLEKVAYIDANGQTYLDTLETELFAVRVTSISAVFTQGQNVIFDTDSLDTLKQYLVVTATYSDNTTAVITTYTLSGTLTDGSSIITVTYGNKTTTFNVTVSQSYSYIQSSGDALYIDTGISLTGNMVVEVDVAFLQSTTRQYMGIIKKVDSYNYRAHFGAQEISSTPMLAVNDAGALYGLKVAYDTSMHTYKLSANTIYIDNTSLNNTSQTTGGWPVGENFWLFYRNTINISPTQQYCNARVYGFRTYENNVLTHNLVPFTQNGDIGLLDRVSGTFVTSTGSGTLTIA